MNMDQSREPSPTTVAASADPNRVTPRTDNDQKRGEASKKHGPLYWLAVNLTKMLRDYIRKHKIGFVLLSVGVVVTLFLTPIKHMFGKNQWIFEVRFTNLLILQIPNI